MARLVADTTGYGFGPPAPDLALGADDFNREQEEIKRKRVQIAELLKQDPNASGWGGVTAAAIRQLGDVFSDRALDKQEQDLGARRAAAAQDWLTKMPLGTAAQPEVNPSAPPKELEQTGGGPPLPTNYKPPMESMGGMVPQMPTYEHKDATPFLPADPKDTMKWAIQGAGFGPFHAAMALDAAKEALARNKKGALEYKEYFDKDTGQKRYGWVNPTDPSQGPVPVGGTEFKDKQPSALEQRVQVADEMLRSRFPGKKEEWYKSQAQGLALGDTVITQDANGGVVISSKSGAGASLAGGGSPAATPGAPPASAPPQRNAVQVKALQDAEADELANPNPDPVRHEKNLAEIRDGIKKYGGTVAAPAAAAAEPPLGPGLKSAGEYSKDPRNTPYLPKPDVPGVVTHPGQPPLNAKQLNDDARKLSEDYSKKSLPELVTAANQIERVATRLSGKTGSGVTRDPTTGEFSGSVPGYGGPMGIMNASPVAFTDDGKDMRTAMSTVNNIMLKVRSGAAVVPQELQRYLVEMGQNIGSDDRQFWNAFTKFKERLGSVEAGVTSGYAPIVRDAFFAHPNTERPEWKSSSKAISTAPLRAQDAQGKWWIKPADGPAYPDPNQNG